jgi:predicted DNA-binding protein
VGESLCHHQVNTIEFNPGSLNVAERLNPQAWRNFVVRYEDQIGKRRLGNLACQGIARKNGAYYVVIMRTISVKLPDELLAQLGREAKARRVTKSRLVRESLEKGLHEQPLAGAVSCYDLARDLAGSVKGLPKDLADNPKYMEGFGR